MFTRRAVLACSPALFLLGSCSTEAPQKAKEPEKPPEPVGAQYAFHQIFLTARTWSSDVLGMRMRDIPLTSVKPDGGKRGAWELTMVAPSKGKARTYSYSVVTEGNIHEGVFAGLEEDYRGPQGQAKPWPIQALKVDSVKAYEIAVQHSAEYMKKYPDMPITFLLEQSRHPFLTWRVIWGTSVVTSGHSIYVSATTGEFVERSR
jgi:hypothetical protein